MLFSPNAPHLFFLLCDNIFLLTIGILTIAREAKLSNFFKLRGKEAAAVVQRQETAAGFLDFPAVW